MDVQVESIKKNLEALILGKSFGAYSCCCGAIKVGESKTVAIINPVEVEHFRNWIYWSVRIREVNKTVDCPYTESLSKFLTKDQIAKIFNDAD